MVSDWQPTLLSTTPKPLHVALGDHVLPLLSILPPRKSESSILWPTIHLYARMLCCSVMSDSFAAPLDCSPPGSSVEFSREEYWSGLPFSPPKDLLVTGIEPVSPVLADRFLYHWATWGVIHIFVYPLILELLKVRRYGLFTVTV